MKHAVVTVTLLAYLSVGSAGSLSPAASATCYAQSKSAENAPRQAPAPTTNQPVRARLAFGLEDGTPIKLRITRTISSAETKVDETVDFEVLEDVKIGDVIVIPRGSVPLGHLAGDRRI